MKNQLLLIVNISLLLITIILTLIYLFSITFVRRFHTTTNILTGNFCLSGMICCLFWIVFDVLSGFYSTILDKSIISCILTQYSSLIVNCLLVYSLALITIDRFFIVIYPSKRLFKKRSWSFILLGIQWILAIILTLPHLIFSFKVNINNLKKIIIEYKFKFYLAMYE
jgi:hypothetical protein